jgi:hypothetical protein
VLHAGLASSLNLQELLSAKVPRHSGAGAELARMRAR